MAINLRNQSNNAQRFAPIKLEILENGSVFYTETTTASSVGNFQFAPIISQTREGQNIVFRYTNTNTQEIAEFPYTLPLLSSVPLALSVDSVIYTGESFNQSYNVFPGVAASLLITKPDNSTQSLNLPGRNDASGSPGLDFPIGSLAGNYTLQLSATGYADPVNKSVEVRHGLVVELGAINGLKFPGDSFDLLVQGTPNDTVILNVFGSSYNLVLDGNGEANYSLVIPFTANFGNNLATFSTPNYYEDKTLTLFVDNPADYVLAASFPNNIITNSKTNNNSAITGVALPGKVITATILGLSLSLQATANSYGEFVIDIPNTIPWIAKGNFTATVSAPGETTLNFSGSHKPDIEIVSTPETVTQGSSAQQFQVRAGNNVTLQYSISGYVNSAQVSTDANGYATIDFPAISINTFVPSSIDVLLKYLAVPEYSTSFVVEVTERVPLTINITNPPSVPNASDVLFINSTYNISGNAPSNGVLGLSAVGSTESLVKNSAANDTYTATLITNGKEGTINIKAATIFQPSAQKTYSVTHPLSWVVPAGTIRYDDPDFYVSVSSSPNIPITLKVYYQSLLTNGAVDKNEYTETHTLTTNNNGDCTFTITPQNIGAAEQIEFELFASNLYSLKETREYIVHKLIYNYPNEEPITIVNNGGFLTYEVEEELGKCPTDYRVYIEWRNANTRSSSSYCNLLYQYRNSSNQPYEISQGAFLGLVGVVDYFNSGTDTNEYLCIQYEDKNTSQLVTRALRTSSGKYVTIKNSCGNYLVQGFDAWALRDTWAVTNIVRADGLPDDCGVKTLRVTESFYDGQGQLINQNIRLELQRSIAPENVSIIN